MSLDFVFLKDQSLLKEIHRHKWLESEKVGRDVGFASAAYDWMNNHYTEWAKHNRRHSNPTTRARDLAGQR